MHKVAAYVANRLPNVDDPAALEQRLELLCNDKLLPMGMSLASVRAFVWKNGAEDVLVHYRRGSESLTS